MTPWHLRVASFAALLALLFTPHSVAAHVALPSASEATVAPANPPDALPVKANDPPVPVGIADGDVFVVPYETGLNVDFSFTSPEAGQTTTISLVDVSEFDGPGSVSAFLAGNTPGNPATASLSVFAGAQTGTDAGGQAIFDITACDDATDPFGADISE